MVRIRRVLPTLPKSSARAGVLAASLVAGVAAGACSASLDFIECVDDNECNTRFAGDGPLRCETGRCVAATCEGHDACASLGESYACGVNGDCIDVVQGECELLFVPGGEIVEDLVFVGAIYDEAAPEGPQIMAAIKLAAEEFNSKTALASGEQVAVIGCDSEGTIAGAHAAGLHLAEVVGVPAIIGPTEDEEFIKVAQDVSNKAGNYNFTMSPTALTPFLDGAGRVWLTTPGTGSYGRAISERIVGYGLDRALVVFTGDNYGIRFQEGVMWGVNQDGAPVIPGVVNQVSLSYDNQSDGTEAIDALLLAITDPSIIVLLGRDEVGAQIKHLASLGTVSPEKIIVTKRALPAVQAALVELGSAEWMAKVEYIAADAAHPVNAAAVQGRLMAKNPALTEVGDAANLAYDAAMTTLLGLRALKSSEPIAGPQLAGTMSRMSSGAVVSFGDDELAFISTAAVEFGMGRTVDLVGASGELAFNTAKNEPCGSFTAYSFTDLATATATPVARYTPECPAASGAWADL